MTFKNAAKNAAFAVGMFVFPIKTKPAQPKLDTGDFDIDAHIASIQASFKNAVKDDLKKNL
jgi:hypothetical protein